MTFRISRQTALRFLPILFSLAGNAQTSNTIFGSGYALPIPIPASPGDVINVFVQGVGSKLTQPVTASGMPLPTTLGGISVALYQAFGPSGRAPEPVPLLIVRPISTCLYPIALAPCGSYVAITLQIPFDLTLTCCAQPPNRAFLVVSENNVAGGAVELGINSYLVHVLNFCDVQALSSIVCGGAPAITHADGNLVSLINPAKSGEELVMYLFGLGATTPAVPTGQSTPMPAPTTQSQFQLNFSYAPNAPPSKQIIVPPACETTPTCPQLQPIFSGLTPGFAGLYQVNFIVPSPPPGTAACNGAGIGSNLTVSVVGPGATSFDGGGICVDTTGSLSAAAESMALDRHRFRTGEHASPPAAITRQFIGLN